MLVSTTNLSEFNINSLPSSTSLSNQEINKTTKIDESELINKDNLGNLSYSLDDDLNIRANSVALSFKDATSGVTLSEITNLALKEQTTILNNIKDKLNYINSETSDKSRDEIRKDIIDLIDTFDTIAKNTNYNMMYSLQESDISTNSSSTYSFMVSEVPAVILSTESIQSNSEGLNLLDLSNLTQYQMTSSLAKSQSDIVSTALVDIKEFEKNYLKLIEEFKTSTTNLYKLHTTFENHDIETREVNYKLESLAFDRNNILKEFSNFSQTQANAIQTRVVDLLS